MTDKIDLNKYKDFVEAITSDASNDLGAFVERLIVLEDTTDVNVPLLNTTAIGLPAEAGEFADIVKKVLFHGKELTDEVHASMVKELSDVIWYWINACRALNVSPEDVIQTNFDKLSARYPDGKFNISSAENRSKDDI